MLHLITLFLQRFNYIHTIIRVKFDGSCLKQDKLPFNYNAVVNAYIVYEINLRLFKQRDGFTLGSSLFGAVKLTKNADFAKHK